MRNQVAKSRCNENNNGLAPAGRYFQRLVENLGEAAPHNTINSNAPSRTLPVSRAH